MPRKWFLRGWKQRQKRLDDIYETKQGAASLTANEVGHCVTKRRRPEWLHMAVGSSSFTKQSKLQCRKAHFELRFQFTYKRTAPFCVSITTQFKALALLFLLWEVHKYWLSCQIIRIINVNPVVDLALILFSSVWHSWKVTPCHTMQTWSYLSTAGSGSLCSVHISSLMPFPPAVRLELTNSAGIIGD